MNHVKGAKFGGREYFFKNSIAPPPRESTDAFLTCTALCGDCQSTGLSLGRAED